jgi:hypothetical protein
VDYAARNRASSAGSECDGNDSARLGHLHASFSAPVGFSSGPDAMRDDPALLEQRIGAILRKESVTSLDPNRS